MRLCRDFRLGRTGRAALQDFSTTSGDLYPLAAEMFGETAAAQPNTLLLQTGENSLHLPLTVRAIAQDVEFDLCAFFGLFEFNCVFRRKPATHSGEACHLFRMKTATHSGRNLPPASF